MNIIYLIVIFSFLFFEFILSSTYLERYKIEGKMKFTFYYNKNVTVKYNLVEIFSPYESFYYYEGFKPYSIVNQITTIFKNDGNNNELFVGSSSLYQYVWVRIIDVIDLIPGGAYMDPSVTVKESTWSTLLTARPAKMILNNEIVCCPVITYSIYAISIYPAANIGSWSSDYSNIKKDKNNILFNAINSSIQSDYLKQYGYLLSTVLSTRFEAPFITFTIASRRIRDFILIIVANGPNKTEIQYPPVYIKGCLSLPDNYNNCRLIKYDYPMYILLGCSIAFLFLTLKYDILHVFFCSWITAGFITLVLWQVIRTDSFFTDSNLYMIGLGIAPAFGIVCTFLFYFTTKKYNRYRMFFTSFVLTIIFLSIMWFTQLKVYKWNNLTLFIIVSIIVAFVLEIIFLVFHYLTMIVGSVFITAVLISLSVSINNLNASIIPFIFIDFYNSLVYPSIDWIYYSPLLYEDLIIIILSPILSLILGLLFYGCFKRSLIREKKRQRDHRSENFIDMELNDSIIAPRPYIIPIVEPNVLNNDLPPTYNQVPCTSNDTLNDPPPSYDACIKMEPTAPAFHSYIGPCK